MQTRMFYVDDSGAAQTGWIVYSWIECLIADWRDGLRRWLDFRKSLFVKYAIPPPFELHATKFINGRGRPSTDDEWNRSKSNRREVAQQALLTISQCDQLKVGTVFRRTTSKRDGYAQEKAAVYLKLVQHLEQRLAAEGEFGLVFVDGNRTEPSYYDAHRELKTSTRHVIEDPLFQESHRSQWIQMADLVSYTAYQELALHEGKEFAWKWYSVYLANRDANGCPQEL